MRQRDARTSGIGSARTKLPSTNKADNENNAKHSRNDSAKQTQILFMAGGVRSHRHSTALQSTSTVASSRTRRRCFSSNIAPISAGLIAP